MVDITAKLFWYRSKEWYRIMADKLNDIVYTDESKESLDVINLLLLGWILLGLIVYIIGNVIATYLRKRKSLLSVPKSETADDNSTPTEHVSCANDLKNTTEDVVPERTEIRKSHAVPICEGDDPEFTDWINNVLLWIYNQRVVSPIIDSWLSALNARTRLSSTEHGILVDFKEVLHTSNPPHITEVRQSWTSRLDANVNCEVDFEDIAFEVVVTQFKENDKIIVPFILNVKKLSGNVNVDCNPEDLTFVAKYSEPPQIESSSEAANNAQITEDECDPLCDLVCEITNEALSSAIVPLRFSCFPNCPRLSPTAHAEEDVFEAAEGENENNLLVKIIKASNLGGSKGCMRPYCVVEMDEPPQRFETQVVEGTKNPFWDEAFTFTVKDSAELLFEIYDKDKPSSENFLGLGIVGIEELEKNPSQRQIIPLQSRPLEEDDVTGSLTAEFLFLNQISPVSDTTHLVPSISKEDGKLVETNSRLTAGGTLITTTTIKRTKEEDSDRMEPTFNPNANPNFIEHNITCLPAVLDQNQNNKFPKAINGDCNYKNICADLCFENEPTQEIPVERKDHQIEVSSSLNDHCTKLDNESDKITNQNGEEAEQETRVACEHVHVPTLVIEEPLENGSVINRVTETNIPVIREPDEDSDSLPPILESPETASLASNGIGNHKDAEADLPGTALKELEKHSSPNATSKSTLIIHSVQRPENSMPGSLEASPASHVSKDSRTSDSVPSTPSQDRSAERSRPKEKKSFMGNLRRRLSFHKTRSKSAENRFENESNYSSRSVSTDRMRHPSDQKLSPFKSRLLGRHYLTIPGSTRSSLSEASGISTASNRTYVNENSTLVIETNENGIIKRYLIPNSLAHRSKWQKKRGTKLHIFNDHVFIAKHLSGVTICKICQKYLTRRPGKQGYECRGCNLQCHKSCHVKVESYCSNSSINSMEVEYVHDPKGASPKSI